MKLWIQAYEKQIQDHLDDLIQMAPWLMLPLWVMIHPIKEDVLTPDSAEEAKRMDELHTELLKLDLIPSLREVPEMAMKLKPMIDQILSSLQNEEEREWFLQLGQMITQAGERASRKDCLH